MSGNSEPVDKRLPFDVTTMVSGPGCVGGHGRRAPAMAEEAHDDKMANITDAGLCSFLRGGAGEMILFWPWVLVSR